MGIHFSIINDEKAKEILSCNTYLFKLAYYRKNFYKYEDGYRIEFAYLSDLANTDMRFRYTLLHMTLDIEHALKCLVMKLISEDKSEDGYTILDDFLCIDKSQYNSYDNQQPFSLEEIKQINKEHLFRHLKKNNKYPNEIQKYIDDPPIWFCIETMQLGQFTSFLEFYFNRSQNPQLKVPSKLMRLVKNVRNKCAHNQAILINLQADESIKAPKELMSWTSQLNLPKNMYRVKPFLDILATFEIHQRFCSKGIKEARKPSLEDVKNRYNRNFNYYNRAQNIQKFYKSMDKIIDNYIDNL